MVTNLFRWLGRQFGTEYVWYYIPFVLLILTLFALHRRLQTRAIARYTHWGCFGVSNYLSSKMNDVGPALRREVAYTSEVS